MNTLQLSERGSMVLKGPELTRVSSAILQDLVDSNRKGQLVCPQTGFKVRVSLSQFTKLARQFRSAKPLTQTVGAYLYSGKALTQKIAADLFRCRSVSSRISELQSIGWVISKEHRRDSLGQSFVVYRFDGFKGTN